ncbi:putative G3BP-like protein [Pseudocercospora fuligena]|uniref:Putative G3BP-like protein n=1 Tax=Pseudocercospora fuligena TaxID=685502 RepID=A0A8H6RE09_9PEZI|nr:putative G3BP-like protein [Pseudocercospora fuligena]
MASEVAGMPNGTYAPHQAYGGIDQNNHAYANNAQAPQQASQQAPPTSSTPSNAQQAQQPDIPKDEVGWYFVEQYYTNLSRSPEKLYLFYNKRSQFVSGQETDKVAVCVGQRAINDKIKDLDFQDCKVRVTNVDSQASDTNIVIQVIGELSNRGQPHRKFTQTFVLATQTNGYFVLNDIFRYLVEEEDETEADTQQPAEEVQQVSGTESGFQEPAPTEAEPKTLTSSTDPAAVEKDAQEVDKEIEQKLVNNVHDAQGAVPAVTNGEPASEEPAAVEEKPSESTEAGKPSAVEAPTAAEVDIEPEKPRVPEPTPVTSPAAQAQAPSQAAAAPAPKPAAPAAPKTWASLAASANRVATPATPAAAAAPATRPAPKAATPTAPAQPASSSTSSAPSAPAAQRQEAQGSDSQDEWTAVSSSHNRQQSRQANNVSQQEESANRGYIKNVSDNVEHNKLRAELEKFGKVAYFDIARQKNCAFVDFESSEGYNKALNTPFKIGDDELYVEKRHIRPGQTPYIPRGQFQGGRGGGRGGAGQGAPRGNYQGGGRGNSNGAPRGRGGFQSQRGARGGAQA